MTAPESTATRRRPTPIPSVASRAATLLWLTALLVLGGPASVFAQSAAANGLKERAQASRAKGDSAAPVLVYEIADFQCPYCGHFTREVLPRIDSAYVRTGKVKWVFVTLPLPVHPYAWASAEAALCAGAVAGRFWPYHDRLFADQDTWSGAPDPMPYFMSYAKDLGIPVASFRACIDGDSVAPVILEDVIAAAASQVTGTPTFVIDNKVMVVGVKSFDEWKGILDKALDDKH